MSEKRQNNCKINKSSKFYSFKQYDMVTSSEDSFQMNSIQLNKLFKAELENQLQKQPEELLQKQRQGLQQNLSHARSQLQKIMNQIEFYSQYTDPLVVENKQLLQADAAKWRQIISGLYATRRQIDNKWMQITNTKKKSSLSLNKKLILGPLIKKR